MGLNFPEDLAAWQRWERSRNVPRRVRNAVRRSVSASPMVLHRRGTDPMALFALDSTRPTGLASVVGPLVHLGDAPAAILAPADVSIHLPGNWTTSVVADSKAQLEELRSVRAVVSTGHFLPVGRAAYAWAAQLGATYVVVQHGLLTPFMAPLPERAHLLAFSDDDARFWRSGRTDVTSEVVGSQLLWEAGKRAAAGARREGGSDTPVFLGQLHGAELPRRVSAATAVAFCRRADALYRPHPAEVDRISRLQHALWKRRGIRFADSGSLAETTGPVVSIFSTGVLEAAAHGRKAWVTCVTPPPTWVREFWDRYELSAWGGTPTAPPPRPAVEPAQAIADAVLALAEGAS